MLFPKTFRCNALKTYFYLEVTSCYLSNQERLCWQESCTVISTFGLQVTLCPSNVSKAIVFAEIVRTGLIVHLGRRGEWAWNGFFFARIQVPCFVGNKWGRQNFSLILHRREREKRFHLPVGQSILSNFGLRNRSTSEWAETEYLFFKEKFQCCFHLFSGPVICLGWTERLITSSLRLRLSPVCSTTFRCHSEAEADVQIHSCQ